MEPIGKLLAGAGAIATGAQHVTLPPEVRSYRVHVARQVFYDVEVCAQSADDAMRMAEKIPPSELKLKFYTALVAHSADVFQPWDQKWVKVPRA